MCTVLIPSTLLAVKAAVGDQFEPQRTGDRSGFDQLDHHRIAKPVGLAAVAPDQRIAPRLTPVAGSKPTPFATAIGADVIV